MNTQRVNWYLSGSKINCYFIEEYNEDLRQWFTVGDTYENIDHALSQVNNHNLKELVHKMGV